MAHYRMQDRLPSAIVTAGGSEKKVYEGNSIFFNKGDNFELRFFNPLQEKIGVEIIFNGQKKSDGLLVVNPGEDITLDRFLDDKKKMVFDTYNIDANNPAAVAAAALNGIVNINFFKEKYSNQWESRSYFSQGVNGTAGYPGSCVWTTISNSNSRVYPRVYCSSTSTTSGDFKDYIAESRDKTIDYSEYIAESLTETGRIEKGDVSNQNLNVVDIQFESVTFHSIQYHLKPTSTKGYTRTSEIRNYCPRCNYRLRKQSWIYCPKCGEKLM